MNLTILLQETVFEGIGSTRKTHPILFGGISENIDTYSINTEMGRKWCYFGLAMNVAQFIPRYIQTICKVVDAIFQLLAVDQSNTLKKLNLKIELKNSAKDLALAPFRLLYTLGQLAWGIYDPKVAIEKSHQRQF